MKLSMVCASSHSLQIDDERVVSTFVHERGMIRVWRPRRFTANGSWQPHPAPAELLPDAQRWRDGGGHYWLGTRAVADPDCMQNYKDVTNASHHRLERTRDVLSESPAL
eukprot:2176656-Rhodomonas_salina.3